MKEFHVILADNEKELLERIDLNVQYREHHEARKAYLNNAPLTLC